MVYVVRCAISQLCRVRNGGLVVVALLCNSVGCLLNQFSLMIWTHFFRHFTLNFNMYHVPMFSFCFPKEPCYFPAQPTVSYGMWGLRLCCLWQLALCTKCTSALASVCLPDPMVVGTTSWQYHWMHAEDARVSPLVPCCPAFFEWLVSTPFFCYRN